MHRACTRLRQRNPDLFVVGSFFAAGEQGAWFDPSDLNTLFQDDAGTVPVTASGQTVGRMLDKSGNGNHATQITAGSRPTFRDVNGLRYLEFDGVDDFLVTANINFTATDKMSVFAGVRKLSDAAAAVVAELSADSGATSGNILLLAPLTAGANYGFRSKGTLGDAITATTFAAPHSAVLAATGDIPADSETLRVNGTAFSSAADQGTGTYGTHPLYIGRRGGTTLPFTGHLYGLILRGALSSAAAISSAERYLAPKTGVTVF